MEIIFKDGRLEKCCGQFKEGSRRWGDALAKKVVQRLNEMKAAENLAILSHLPPTRCHMLRGKRAGQFAVDLVHPFRLIFEPVGNPKEYTVGHEIDRSKIAVVRVLEVIDYHGP